MKEIFKNLFFTHTIAIYLVYKFGILAVTVTAVGVLSCANSLGLKMGVRCPFKIGIICIPI